MCGNLQGVVAHSLYLKSPMIIYIASPVCCRSVQKCCNIYIYVFIYIFICIHTYTSKNSAFHD